MVHFLKPKQLPEVKPFKCRTDHANAIYQPGYTHKFCPDCSCWLPDENHPDNQPKEADPLDENPG